MIKKQQPRTWKISRMKNSPMTSLRIGLDPALSLGLLNCVRDLLDLRRGEASVVGTLSIALWDLVITCPLVVGRVSM